MTRKLLLVHRWIGIFLSVFMLAWFSTGLGIVYSGNITQSREDQLAHAETLNPEPGWLTLGAAWERSAKEREAIAFQPRTGPGSTKVAGEAQGLHSIADARLKRIAGEAYWIVEDSQGRHYAISAIDGRSQLFSVEQAYRIGHQWLARHTPDADQSTLTYIDTFEATSSLRHHRALKPFHRFAVKDSADTELLISARTGEVVQAATRVQRGYFLISTWIHLFGPLESLGLDGYRRGVAMTAGSIAIIGSLTGLIIGWQRWRPGWFGRPTYSHGRAQPYRSFWQRWHFWAGLIGGSFALLWASSGVIATNPGHIFSPAEPSHAEFARFLGPETPEAIRTWIPGHVPSDVAGEDVVEVALRRLNGQAVILAYSRAGKRLPLPAEGVASQFDLRALTAAAERLSGARLESPVLQWDYDNFYYPGHRQTLADRPLPVVRVDLADAGHTRLYIDPVEGRLVLKEDSSRRVFRWLYPALHHWDSPGFYKTVPWHVWMSVWIGFGLVLSISAVVIGVRRLQHSFTSYARRHEDALIGSPVPKSSSSKQ
jgi:hypothetical protein